MVQLEPREAAERATVLPQPRHDDERLVGSGIMGLPFGSGHYLALRDWRKSSVAAGYRSVWHRSPAGRWSMWSDAEPDLGCDRYWSAAFDSIASATIEVDWVGSRDLRVTIPDVLEWSMRLGSSMSTRCMNLAGAMLPEPAWSSDGLLHAMGRMAGPVLGVGRVCLTGSVANGQHYKLAPRWMWVVEDSTAALQGHDLGRPAALDQQERLADMWMPQRGVFAVGSVRTDAYDPSMHQSASNPPPRAEFSR